MNWKCKIGLHDWVIIEEVSSMSQIIENIKASKVLLDNKRPTPHRVIALSSGRIINKVCVRPDCSKVIDQITPAMKLGEDILNRVNDKKLLAKKIWENRNE